LFVVALVVGPVATTTTSAAAASCGGAVRQARIAVGLPARFDYIAWRESRCNPRAYNRSGAAGLYQEMPVIRRWCARRIGAGSAFNITWNTRCAATLYRHSGYRPWGTR